MTDDAVLPALVRCTFRRLGLAALEDSGALVSFFWDFSSRASFLESCFEADFLVVLLGGGFADLAELADISTGLRGSTGGGLMSLLGRGVVGVAFGVHLVPLPVIYA